MAKGTETNKRFDITKQKLDVYYENFYFDDSRNAFVALYEYDFNPDEYFGTTINKPNGPAYLNFVTQWDFDKDDISMYYYGEFPEVHKETIVLFPPLNRRRPSVFYGRR